MIRLRIRLELEWKVLLLAAVLFAAFVWPVQRFFITRLSKTLTESIDPGLEQTLRNEIVDAAPQERAVLTEHLERYRQTKVLIPIIVREQQRLITALSVGLFISFLLIAFWVLRYLTQPLKNLAVAVGKIGKGEVAVFSRHSDGALGIVETAVANLQTELVVLREKERVLGMEAAWKDIARIMAHEIKNPLTPIRLTLDRIEEKVGSGQTISSDDLTRFLVRINTQIDMLERLVDQFRSFSRDPEVNLTAVDVGAVIRTIGDTLGEKLSTVITGSLVMQSDPYLLQQVFLNIWKNSLEAGATIIETTIGKNDGQSMITIGDNGQGIAPDDLERIWLPYVTFKKHGTGLGLPVVKRLIETLGGTITMTSVLHHGITITISFPQYSLQGATDHEQ